MLHSLYAKIPPLTCMFPVNASEGKDANFFNTSFCSHSDVLAIRIHNPINSFQRTLMALEM